MHFATSHGLAHLTHWVQKSSIKLLFINSKRIMASEKSNGPNLNMEQSRRAEIINSVREMLEENIQSTISFMETIQGRHMAEHYGQASQILYRLWMAQSELGKLDSTGVCTENSKSGDIDEEARSNETEVGDTVLTKKQKRQLAKQRTMTSTTTASIPKYKSDQNKQDTHRSSAKYPAKDKYGRKRW